MTEYKIKLKYPDFPLIDFTTPNSSKTYVPAEVCEILPGQAYKGELDKEQRSKMIRFASKNPKENKDIILSTGLNLLGFKPGTANTASQSRSVAVRDVSSDGVSEILQGFGIGISAQMTTVPGRILTLPKVLYRGGHMEVVNKERASWDFRNALFASGATLEKNWAVLVIKDGRSDKFSGANDDMMKICVEDFMRMCEKSGMQIVSKTPAKYVDVKLPPQNNKSDPTRKAAIDAIKDKINGIKPKPTFILVLLSNSDSRIYSGIKYICDVSLDIHTICAISKNFADKKGQMQYFANEALKLNMKLGGINHFLGEESMKWLKENTEENDVKAKGKRKAEDDKVKVGGTMLVGMDVTHPSPGTVKGTPSIVAVVASIDDSFIQFPAGLAIQESKKEVRELCLPH